MDDDLVAQLVADTESGEALPLLAFTLAQLAEGVGRGGQLSAVRYKQLGGVHGALTRQADAALAEASAASGRGRREVIAGLVRLVTVDELGRPTRWRVPRDEPPELVTRELDVFVTRRLLTTDNDGVVMGVTFVSGDLRRGSGGGHRQQRGPHLCPWLCSGTRRSTRQNIRFRPSRPVAGQYPPRVIERAMKTSQWRGAVTQLTTGSGS